MKVQDILIEWAAWVHSESEGRIYYPSRTAFDRMRGGGIRSAMISEEAAESVSQAMAKLSRQKPVFFDVLERYYLQSQSLSKIARERKESRHMVSQALFAAENVVEVMVLGLDD